MNSALDLPLLRFALVYILLLAVLWLMKKARIHKTALLITASMRMTVQLILAGLLLTWIFKHPHPLLTLGYVCAMVLFAIHRVLSQHRGLNKRFQWVVAASLAGSGLAVLLFFVCLVIGVNITEAQYTIPLGGMIIGNAMTGLSLALNTFEQSLAANTNRLTSLLNWGAHPQDIVRPMANAALETALLPTINSMLGTGIVWLPGMLTGQILAGTLPTTAMLYQIAIMIAICAVVCLAVFCSLYFGCHTLYDKHYRLILANPPKE
jgi:putative ABC transport system permease protein